MLVLISILSLCFAAPAPAQEQVTLRFMGWIGLFDFYVPAWEAMIEEFEAQHPGVTIEYIGTPFEETLNQATTAILGGNAPDIIQAVSGWTPQLNQMGALASLDSLIDESIINGVADASREALTFDGQLKALEWVPAPIVMVYNRNLLEEAGLDPDSPPQTWPEFVAAVEAVCALPAREDGGSVYGVSLRTVRHPNSGHWALPVIWGFGGDILSPDGNVTVADAPAVAALQWYQDVVTSNCSPEGFGVQESRNVFAQGRAGFIFEGPWIRGLVNSLSEGALEVAPDGDVWLAPMPADPNGDSRMIANSHVLVISEQSPNKELAAEFIEFITTDPQAVEEYYTVSDQPSTAQLDLLTSGAMGEDEMVQVFVDAMPGAASVPLKHPQWNAMTDSLSLAIQQVLQGVEPETALQQAATEIEQLLAS
jgi:multiple sugar transport system substrate-binding protein